MISITEQKEEYAQKNLEQTIRPVLDSLRERLKEIKASDWKQGWTNGKGAYLGYPQSYAGKSYRAYNVLPLQLYTAKNKCKMPVFITQKQAEKECLKIKSDAVGITINGSKLYNIDETNLRDVNQDKYDSLYHRFQGPQTRDEKGMYVNEAIDKMIQDQTWICRIQSTKLVDGAFYSTSRDLVVVPMKEQFNISDSQEGIYKDGMEYYSSMMHEMCHSTGTANRLNRPKGAKFGDAKYAREECVAELTAAIVGSVLGFDKRIIDNNCRYTQGWIKAMRQEPGFVKSLFDDISKASFMILRRIDTQRMEMGLEPYLNYNRPPLTEVEIATRKKFEAFRQEHQYDPEIKVEADGQLAFFKKNPEKQTANFIQAPLLKELKESLNPESLSLKLSKPLLLQGKAYTWIGMDPRKGTPFLSPSVFVPNGGTKSILSTGMKDRERLYNAVVGTRLANVIKDNSDAFRDVFDKNLFIHDGDVEIHLTNIYATPLNNGGTDIKFDGLIHDSNLHMDSEEDCYKSIYDLTNQGMDNFRDVILDYAKKEGISLDGYIGNGEKNEGILEYKQQPRYIESTSWNSPRKDRFEIIDSFPPANQGYQVWNIGVGNFGKEYVKQGYIPLCKCDKDFHVDLSSLKTVNVGDYRKARELMFVSGFSTIDRQSFDIFMNAFKPEYIHVQDAEKKAHIGEGTGRWHNPHLNEMRVYQRYGQILNDWLNRKPCPLRPVYPDKENYMRNLDNRIATPLESLMLTAHAVINDFENPVYYPASKVEKSGLMVDSKMKPVPVFDEITGTIENYYNIDQTNLKELDPKLYEMEVEAGQRRNQPAIFNSSAVALFETMIDDNKWHSRIEKVDDPDDLPLGYPYAYYDRENDKVVVSENSVRTFLASTENGWKDAVLTSLSDSLLDSGRVKSSKSLGDTPRSIARLMNAIHYNINISDYDVPSVDFIDKISFRSIPERSLEDPQYLKDVTDTASKVVNGIYGRAIYLQTGVEDDLSRELSEKAQETAALDSSKQEEVSSKENALKDNEEKRSSGLGM